MGYFAAFLICHLTFRHRFTSTGSRLLDYTRDFLVYLFVLSWAGAVSYSRFVHVFILTAINDSCTSTDTFSHRYHLIYHSARQVLWGTAIGVICGISYYAMVEYVPSRFPSSHLGRIRTALLVHPISIWLRLRDGWSVYPDGGTEDQWQAWKNRWDTQRSIEKKIQ